MSEGTEALGRLLARRAARTGGAFTKGEGGLFTGSEAGGGHTASTVKRGLVRGVEAMKDSTVTTRHEPITVQGAHAQLRVSNPRATAEPDTPPETHHAIANGEWQTGTLVHNGTAVDAEVLHADSDAPRGPDYPGMARDTGGTAMMGAAADGTASAPAPAPAQPKPVVVQAPPAQPAQPNPAQIAKDLADDAERDQRISDLEGEVKSLRTELDGLEEVLTNQALSEMDTWTEEGGDAAMPQSMIAAVGARYVLPSAMVDKVALTHELPPALVASVSEAHQLPEGFGALAPRDQG